MITFEMEDLIGVLQGLTPYLIAMGVAIIAAIAVIIALVSAAGAVAGTLFFFFTHFSIPLYVQCCKIEVIA